MAQLTPAEIRTEIDRIEREMATEFEQRWNMPESECIARGVAQVERMSHAAMGQKAQRFVANLVARSARS